MQNIDYLKRKLDMRKIRIDLRYQQYDQKKIDRDMGITVPVELREQYRSVIGWCTKAVDVLADRLVFRDFGNDDFDINEIFMMNNPDVFFDSAILNALISSCCFVYISKSLESDIPRLQIIEGRNATGIIDPITGLLKEGYAVLERDDNDNPTLEAYFDQNRTTVFKNAKTEIVEVHNLGYPMLVPIIHRPDAKRPFGRSRISRAAMYYQAYAKRTLERSDITAEFYSFPQKYILGMSPEAEAMDIWKATISAMLRIDKDSDGDRPTVGQFTTSSMSPFTEQLRTAAAGFAGETGLTLDDLGFVSDNPSSSEAIKASHENLRAMGRKAQRCFSSGFLNVGFVAACLRDNFQFRRYQFMKTTARWNPIFEPDASTISLVGDGVIKMNQAVPGYFGPENIRDLTGIKGAENE